MNQLCCFQDQFFHSVFMPQEADYPAGLAPVTPQSYRADLHAARAPETTTDPDRKAELEKALLSKEQQQTYQQRQRRTRHAVNM